MFDTNTFESPFGKIFRESVSGSSGFSTPKSNVKNKMDSLYNNSNDVFTNTLNGYDEDTIGQMAHDIGKTSVVSERSFGNANLFVQSAKSESDDAMKDVIDNVLKNKITYVLSRFSSKNRK